MVKYLETEIMKEESNRKRLISDDIFKEIDDQMFAERPKELTVRRETKKEESQEDEQGEEDEDSEEIDDMKSDADQLKLDYEIELGSSSEEDESPDTQEELDPNRGLALSEFSDKYLQKLQKLSDQQVERVRLMTSGVDKSTQAFKKLNKGFKQQTQQINQKVQSQLSSQLRSQLTKSTTKLRKNTVSKVQNYYDEQLDQTMTSMFSRLQTNMIKKQEEQLKQKKNQIECVKEAVRECLVNEFRPVVVSAVEKTFNGQVVVPYVSMTNDYLQRHRAQNQEVTTFMEE